MSVGSWENGKWSEEGTSSVDIGFDPEMIFIADNDLLEKKIA